MVIGRKLKKIAIEEDPTRLVTSAIDRTWFLDGTRGPAEYKDIWDVHGYNWIKWPNFDVHHKQFPNRKILISEYRYYTNTAADSSDEFIQKRDYIAGSSMWTGTGYKGEADWPNVSRPGSLWNLVHEPAGAYWRARATFGFQSRIWSLHVEPATGGWKGADGDKIVFDGWTNCETVDVFVNDVLKKTITMRKHDGTNPWSEHKYLFKKDMAIHDTIQFVPGSMLRFSGKNGGVEMARQIFKPMLAPTKLIAVPETDMIGAEGDVSVVTITIQDSNGNVIKTRDVSVEINVSGAGTLIGLGSADVDGTRHALEPEKNINHKFTYEGLLKAFIKSTGKPGKIIVTASAPGLVAGNTSITVNNNVEY